MCHNIVSVYYTCGINATSDIHWWSSSHLWSNCSFVQSSTTFCFPVCMCVLISQDQAFGELEKNSDKILQETSSSDSSQPAHLHELLCSLQKQLLAYCHINCVTEVLAQLNVYHEQTWISISNRPCIFLVRVVWFSSVCESVFFQGSSSVALLHKHLQLLLPHATDIYNRSATLLKESSGNGSVREKLRGTFNIHMVLLNAFITICKWTC